MVDRDRILTYVGGLLHFYGVLGFEELFGAVTDAIPDDVVSRDELQIILSDAAADEDNPYAFEEWQGCYCDYSVEDPAVLLAEQQRREMLPFRSVSEDEAICVMEDRYASLWNEGENRFFAWLQEKSGCEETIALGLMLEYQDCLRNDMAPMDLIMTVVEILNINLNEVEEVSRVIVEFADHVPLWKLKGWSPAQVRMQFKNG
jgi:hypothetical protein